MLKIEADDLRQAALTLEAAQKSTLDAMRAAVAPAIANSWVAALSAAASTAQQTKLLVSGAGADVGTGRFDLHAARGPALSGGLTNASWQSVDMGITPRQVRSAKRGTSIWIGRNLPSRDADGRVVLPTLGEQSQVYVEAWATGLMGTVDGSVLEVDDEDVRGQVAGSWR